MTVFCKTALIYHAVRLVNRLHIYTSPKVFQSPIVVAEDIARTSALALVSRFIFADFLKGTLRVCGASALAEWQYVYWKGFPAPDPMRRDSIFFQLFKRSPEIVFTLMPQPPENTAGYTFESVAVKETSLS
jgi:hypothetical protein